MLTKVVKKKLKKIVFKAEKKRENKLRLKNEIKEKSQKKYVANTLLILCYIEIGFYVTLHEF